jgi:uncharacterized protein (TIGR02246 family)
MSDTAEIEIVLSYIEAINAHDLSKLIDLMTDDHIFVDSLGKRMNDKEQIHDAWQKFIDMFPDYEISVTDILHKGNVVGIFGKASGTYTPKQKHTSDGHWEIPAAWKAVVKDGRIALWQIIADFEPVRQMKARINGT